jgi:hypothetical protein
MAWRGRKAATGAALNTDARTRRDPIGLDPAAEPHDADDRFVEPSPAADGSDGFTERTHHGRRLRA